MSHTSLPAAIPTLSFSEVPSSASAWSFTTPPVCAQGTHKFGQEDWTEPEHKQWWATLHALTSYLHCSRDDLIIDHFWSAFQCTTSCKYQPLLQTHILICFSLVMEYSCCCTQHPYDKSITLTIIYVGCATTIILLKYTYSGALRTGSSCLGGRYSNINRKPVVSM